MQRKSELLTVFPSWSHLDRQSMRDFRQAATLFATPIEICEEIAPRQDWFSIAQGSIRRSDYVVLILTANSAASAHCQTEVSYATSIGIETLIWIPRLAQTVPEWARDAERLGEHAIDARQAVAATLMMLNRPLRRT